MRRKFSVFLFILSFLLLLPNFLPVHLVFPHTIKASWDTYDPGLVQRVRSVDDLLRVTDSTIGSKGDDTGKLQYAVELDTIVRKRFYHEYSHYALSENWIAALAGYFVSEDLSAIVLTDDILKYSRAACSQQSMVMMEALKRKGISSRKVGFEGHYALEASIEGKWYYFDTNLEPVYVNNRRISFDSIKNNNLIPVMYKGRLDSSYLSKQLVFKEYGVVDAPPAPNASLFHTATKWGSRLLWILPLSLAVFLWRRRP